MTGLVLSRNRELLLSPISEIDELTAFRAEGPVGVTFVGYFLTASGTFDHRHFGAIITQVTTNEKSPVNGLSN
jgi:hypothetical protein